MNGLFGRATVVAGDGSWALRVVQVAGPYPQPEGAALDPPGVFAACWSEADQAFRVVVV